MELESLTALESGLQEQYVLGWPVVEGQDTPMAVAYVVMKRKGGFLLAIPSGFLDQEVLQHAASEEDIEFGLHTKLAVPVARGEKEERDLEEDVEVLVVDAKAEVAGCLRPASDADLILEDILGYVDDLAVQPDPDALLRFTKQWLEVQTDQRIAFYSAAEVSGEEEEVVPVTPGPGRKAPKEAKQKRVTTATLVTQLSELSKLLPDLANQVASLKLSQDEMKAQMGQPSVQLPPRASQLPVSGQLMDFAAKVGIPPKVKGAAPSSVPPLPVRKTMKPGVDTGLTPQEDAEEHSPGGDALARAMLEQSRALSSLVAHMQQGDPLLDAASSSAGPSLGSKGALGREKLQAELAARSGGFYMSVLQNAIRRMRPASRLPSSLQEVPGDFSMVSYLERFGGYGGSRDLGLVQFNLAHMFDAALTSDLDGMKEHLALLMVAVEQAVQDSNRWELAYQLCLLEEPPTQIWQGRGGSSHRVRAFAPLCPQRWATVALAYTKEVDFIQTKRQELVRKNPKDPPPPRDPPVPKRKPKFPKQGSGQKEGEE